MIIFCNTITWNELHIVKYHYRNSLSINDEEEKDSKMERNSNKFKGLGSNITNINKNEKLKAKLENCETYCHYFLSYQIQNFKNKLNLGNM